MIVGAAEGFDDLLPEGIYFRNQQRPGEAFAVVFLSVADGAGGPEGHSALSNLWSTYDWLRAGVTPELPGWSVPTPSRLTFLLGYGSRVFERGVLEVPRPAGLSSFTDPVQHEPILLGAGVPWRSNAPNMANSDLVVQLIGGNELAVRRAVLETCELLNRGSSGVFVTGWYTGFQRDDRRSWLGFHDGVSNLASGQERKQVILIDPRLAAADQWTVGGTYMAYMRIAIDVSAWRTLDEVTQEALVGRSKGSGCPLIAASDESIAVPGCPSVGNEVTWPGNDAYHEPPGVVDAVITASHVQRANKHRPADREESGRIFRQGFEYLEPVQSGHGYEAGLNFVSFQNTSTRLVKVLTQPGWLGSTNFGGIDGEFQALNLLGVSAAGFYVVPPIDDQEFPAAAIWAR